MEKKSNEKDVNHYIDKVLNVLNSKPLFDIDDNNNFIFTRPIGNAEIAEKLKVRLKGNARTNKVSDFLNAYNPDEMNFYKDAKDAIWGPKNFNPRETYKFKEYFVPNECHKELCELLKVNEKGQLKPKLTFQLGKKGSGKTITQNVWLGDVNEKFEDSNMNIFWVRLDVEKLYDLRKEMSKKFDRYLEKKGRKAVLVSTKEYFLGQLLYVFCKHFKEFPYQDHSEPEKNKCTSSKLIKKIYKSLYDSYDENDIIKMNLSNEEKEHYNDLQMLFQSSLGKFGKFKKENCTKITDYLSYLEEVIAIDEGTWKNNGEARLPFAPDRRRSYLIDHVFSEGKDSIAFKRWKYLGETLRKFILNNGYRILYIVDGIDNIYFENPASKEKYNELIEELLDFPVSPGLEGTGNENELVFMAMRDSTFTEFEKRYTAPDRNLQNYLDEESKKVFMDNSIRKETIKDILEERAKIIKKSIYAKKSKMAIILDRILTISHDIEEADLKRIWNSNYRSFLYSRLYLAKYITFRHYWRDSQRIYYSDREIDDDIDRFEDINFYLNGEMYAQGMENDDGTVRFNIFDFIDTLTQKPLYFVYTYILQVIKKIDEEDRYSSNIVDIIEQLGFSRDDCQSCINDLEKSGMLEQRFYLDENEFAYDVTEKGKFISEKFYSNIQYLYHSCIDTKQPSIIFDSIKGYISPNDVPPGGDRNFPVNCIIVSIYFLNFLKFEHKRILENKKIWKVLSETHSEEHIDIKTFELPINYELLKQSICQMLEIVIKKNSQVEILEEWLRKMQQKSKK